MYVAVCQNLVPLVNIKIAGKWMFIPLKMVLIGIDPYPFRLLCTLSYYIVFFIIYHISNFMILHYVILYCVILHYIILYYSIFYYVTLYYIIYMFILSFLFYMYFHRCICAPYYVFIFVSFCRYSALVCGEKQSSMV